MMTKPFQSCRGENAVDKFMEKMLDAVKYCRNTISSKFNKPLKMTKIDEENFTQAHECHICNKKYDEKDHCHVTGKYRSSAHEACNLNFQLTGKNRFYSILNNQRNSDDEYKHANRVWKGFRLKNMGEYHHLYLTSDILLLADVFENFRKKCLEVARYLTSPGLSWDSMLKMTDIQLELMTDINMFQFVGTDSLTYEIETKDVYEDLWKSKDIFDNSDYPKDSKFYNKTNKKVIGKLKDEAGGQLIAEFVGLRSKMYSYI